MNGTVDDFYYEWLYSQVGNVRNRNHERTRWALIKELYTTPFEWFVPNDDNRFEDGRELRHEFLSAVDISVTVDWMELECSILEMLIALSRRASFQSFGEPYDWFWHFIDNLGLGHLVDSRYTKASEQEVNNKLNILNKRLYSRTGEGGLFPLRRPGRDQRKVEIWYQLASYLLEGDNGPNI